MLWLLAALQIWVADESDKVRPDARPPAVAQAPRIRLAAAGGECVGAQVVIRGPALGLTAVARGKPQLDLYRVGTIFLEHPSGPDGETVIAKRCQIHSGSVERLIYEEILTRVPVPGLSGPPGPRGSCA